VSIAEKFYTMEYGAAPEDPKEACNGSTAITAASTNSSAVRGYSLQAASIRPPAIPQPAKPSPKSPKGNTADVEAAVFAARKALPAWQALSCHERARYLYALARQVQKHSRRLAVLETMDNGKPIRESRDIDIPLVARHFITMPAGLSFLNPNFPTTRPAASSARSFVELSAADVCLESSSGSGRGQHGGHQAGKIYSTHRARIC